MKAAVFSDIGVLSIEDKPAPRPELPDDVLVRVLACGVCGTDVHILSDPPAHPATRGVVLGHEFVGEVAAVGPAVATVRPGDRVVIRPILTCGKCRYCRSGASNHCAAADAIGVYRDGGLATEVIAPESACVPIDAAVPAHLAALAEPLACVLNAVGRARLTPGEDVVIFGAGAIGLLFLAVLRTSGAGRIVVVEPSEARREVAERMGADVVLDPIGGSLLAGVAERMPDGPGVVVDAVGSQLAAAVDVAAPQARIVLFGMNSTARPEVSQFRITEKELSVLGSYVGQHSFGESVRLLESGRLDLAPIVSHVIGLDELPHALDELRSAAAIKAVVTFGET